MTNAFKSRTQLMLTTARRRFQTEKETDSYAMGHLGGFFFFSSERILWRDSIGAERGESRIWARGEQAGRQQHKPR